MRTERFPPEHTTHLNGTGQRVAIDALFDSRKLRRGFSLGGFLTLAMESQMPYRANSQSFYRIALAAELLKLEGEPRWDCLAAALKLQFESAREEIGSASGRELGIVGEIPDYSLEPLNTLFQAEPSQVPVLKWDDNLIKEVRARISSLGREVIAVHFRQSEPTATPFGLAFSEFFRQLMQEASLERYTFMVLGDNIPPGLGDNPRVFFAKEKGWSLEQQLVASSQTACLIGEASGFCTAAVFSPTPYLIYKDPDQHAGTVERDIGPGGEILFSNDSQLFLREIPTSENAATKITTLIARSPVGSRMTWPVPGVERLP